MPASIALWGGTSGRIRRGIAQVLLLAGCCLVATPVKAVPQYSREYPRFLADVASRLGPDGKPIILVAIDVCHDGLHFERDPTGFQSLLEYSLIAYDDHGRQVGGDTWRRRIHVDHYEATLSDSLCAREVLTMPVAAGPHTIAVGLTDRRSGEQSRLEFPVLVGGKELKGWRLSDIIFHQTPGPASDSLASGTSLPFSSAPGDFDGFLHPSRSYGGDAREVIAEVELYARAGGETFPPADLEARYSIEDWEGREVASGPAERVASAPSEGGKPAWARFLVRHPVDDLGRGRYSLEIACRGGPLGKRELTQRGTFEVRNSAAFWRRDFLEAVETLTYIGSVEELEVLRRAPVRERRQAWRAFWDRRDPTPDTARNEWEEEYMRRVDYANQNLGTFHETGWRSDRGRVYILKGPPDDIERTVLGSSNGAMETWYYYRSGEVYVFVDETGFGDYRLRRQDMP